MYMIYLQGTSVLFGLHDVMCMRAAFYPVLCDCVIVLRFGWLGAKTIKKNTNSTQNISQTHRAKQYEVTSFLSTDCELSTETCSKNVYSLGPKWRISPVLCYLFCTWWLLYYFQCGDWVLMWYERNVMYSVCIYVIKSWVMSFQQKKLNRG